MTTHFVADVHIGNHRRFGGRLISGVNSRASEVVDILSEAVKLANSKGEPLMVLGDLCDTPRPTPQLLSAIGKALTPLKDCSGPVILLVGNHDRASMGDNDHALAPLGWIEGVEVVDTPRIVKAVSADSQEHLICIPHRPEPASEWLEDAVAALNPPKGGVLCVHLGIEDKNTPWFLQGSADSIHIKVLRKLVKKHSLAAVFAGNWHDRREWEGPNGEPIVQVGALVPTGFDNPGLKGYGSVYRYSEGETSYTELAGPRYATYRAANGLETTLDEIARSDIANYLRARYVTDSQTLIEGESEVEHLKTHDALDELLVEVAVKNMQEAAISAAEGVKKGVSFDEVLANYVAEMDLGDIHKEVLHKVKGYLNAH